MSASDIKATLRRDSEKSLRLILALALSAMPCLVQAQTVRVGGCDEKREQCVLECRARMFSIDPRRSICLGNVRRRGGRLPREVWRPFVKRGTAVSSLLSVV